MVLQRVAAVCSLSIEKSENCKEGRILWVSAAKEGPFLYSLYYKVVFNTWAQAFSHLVGYFQTRFTRFEKATACRKQLLAPMRKRLMKTNDCSSIITKELWRDACPREQKTNINESNYD